MVYENEEKIQESKSAAKPAESTQKTANPAASPSQQPVWTQAMGDHPPASLQAKLTINQPGDPFEQEADRVADQVVMRKHNATPAILGEEEEEEQKLRRKQRSTGAQATQGESAPPIVNQALSSGGQPLDAGTQASMESHFGQDFSGVRIHTGGQAANSAQAINARAYTVGQDVVFGEGQYAPGTGEGERLLAHELTHVVQQSPETIQVQMAPASGSGSSGTITPEELIKRYTNWGGLNLKEEELGADLLGRLPSGSAFVGRVLDALSSTDKDDVAYEIAHQATDTQISAIAADPDGKALFMRIVRELQSGSTDNAEAAEIERIIRLISPSHAHLKSESWSTDPAVKSALAASGTTLQSISSGTGDYIYDEYSVIIDKMPPGLTPEAYLSEMSVDLNKAVSDSFFDTINVFRKRSTGIPAIGDIYDIDIAGPDNGSVMLVESTSSHFIFQTITTPFRQTGSHPEYGSREFGFERNRDGSITFYTRGASRSGPVPGTALIGRPFQTAGWTRLMRGISDAIDRRGGHARPLSFSMWTSHRD